MTKKLRSAGSITILTLAISFVIIFFSFSHFRLSNVNNILIDIPSAGILSPFGPIANDTPIREQFTYPGGTFSYVSLYMATYGKHIGQGKMTLTLQRAPEETIASKNISLSQAEDNQYLQVNFSPMYLPSGTYELIVTAHGVDKPFAIWMSKAIITNANLEGYPGENIVFTLGSTSTISFSQLLTRLNQFHPIFLSAYVVVISFILFIVLSIFFLLYILLKTEEDLTKYARIGVIFLIAILILKNIVWTSISPMWQTPDEQAFYSYTESLIMNRHLPTVDVNAPDYNTWSREVNASYTTIFSGIPHNSLITENFSTIFFDSNLSNLEKLKLDPTSRINHAGNYVEGNPPFFFAYEAIPYLLFFHNSIIVRFFAMRIFSSFLSIINVFFAFLIFRELFYRRKISYLLTFTMIMQPMFSMIATSITSQNMVNMLFTIFIYFLIVFYKQIRVGGRIEKVTVIMGSVVALGLLTKAQMFAAIPLFLVVFGYALYQNRKYNISHIIKALIYFSFPILLLYGWWAVFSYRHYHTFYGSIGVGPNMPATTLSPKGFISHFLVRDFLNTNFWSSITGTLWANFGWLDTYFDGALYTDIGYVIGFASIGVLLFYVRFFFSRLRKDSEKNELFDENVFHILMLAFIFVVVLLLAIDYEWIKTVTAQGFLQGQYYLVAIVPFISLLLIGVFSCMSWIKRLNNIMILSVLAYAFALGMFALNIASIFLIVNRFYL